MDLKGREVKNEMAEFDIPGWLKNCSSLCYEDRVCFVKAWSQTSFWRVAIDNSS